MQTVGPHRVETKSIEQVNYTQLLGGETADVLYTDPPWGDRMMSFFGTMREKQAGQDGDNISYEAMLRALRDIVREHVDGVVVIAASLDDDTVEAMLSDVLYNVQTQITQYRGSEELRKNKMILAGSDPSYQFDGDISMMQGVSLAKEAVGIARECAGGGDLLLDPMCGQGNAAVAALANDMRFAGNEFNVARANDCIEKIVARMENN